MFVSLLTEAGDLFRGKPASNEAADEEGLVLFAELAEISPLKFQTITRQSGLVPVGWVLFTNSCNDVRCSD
jgi:hypothetical protein